MSASPRRKHAIDLDYIIGLCVIKLKPPQPRSAPSTLLASAVDAAETAVATEVTHLIGSETTRLATDLLAPVTAEAEPRARCPLPARISACPALLLVAWIALRCFVGGFGILAPVLMLAMPYVAVGLSLVALVAQSWLVARPIAFGLASLLTQLTDIIEGAFDELIETVPKALTEVLLLLMVPEAIANELMWVLFEPIREALHLCWALVPKVDDLVPQRWRAPKPLVFLVWLLLLCGLVVAQTLTVLFLGLVGTGDLAIAICVGVCAVLAFLARNASRLIELLLGLVECLINFTLQFLLRRVLLADKIQFAIDMISDAIPDLNDVETAAGISTGHMSEVEIEISEA